MKASEIKKYLEYVPDDCDYMLITTEVYEKLLEQYKTLKHVARLIKEEIKFVKNIS